MRRVCTMQRSGEVDGNGDDDDDDEEETDLGKGEESKEKERSSAEKGCLGCSRLSIRDQPIGPQVLTPRPRQPDSVFPSIASSPFPHDDVSLCSQSPLPCDADDAHPSQRRVRGALRALLRQTRRLGIKGEPFLFHGQPTGALQRSWRSSRLILSLSCTINSRQLSSSVCISTLLSTL